MEKLKRSIVKEEFVELTGDYRASIILNQFIYWSERVKDFDKFIDEENRRIEAYSLGEKIELSNGWIYKTAEELKEECMLKTLKKVKGQDEHKVEYVKDATVLSYIEYLVTNRWIDKRTNPLYKWDRTYQYRVNLLKVCEDLLDLGYVLQDYKIPLSLIISQIQKMKIESSKNENQTLILENRNIVNRNAIPEITTEITSKNSMYVEDENLRQIKMLFEGNIGTINSIIAEELIEISNKIDFELFEQSIKISCDKGKRAWGYIKGIINNFINSNIKTINDYKVHLIQQQENKIKESASKDNKIITPKTKFHNFEQRFEKYNPKDLDSIMLENNKRKWGTK